MRSTGSSFFRTNSKRSVPRFDQFGLGQLRFLALLPPAIVVERDLPLAIVVGKVEELANLKAKQKREKLSVRKEKVEVFSTVAEAMYCVYIYTVKLVN